MITICLFLFEEKSGIFWEKKIICQARANQVHIKKKRANQGFNKITKVAFVKS